MPPPTWRPPTRLPLLLPTPPPVFIAICAKLGLIRPAEWSTDDTDDVAAGMQNFLICIEMFMAAVAHAHAFPPRVRPQPRLPGRHLLSRPGQPCPGEPPACRCPALSAPSSAPILPPPPP